MAYLSIDLVNFIFINMELPEAPIQRHYNDYPKDFTPGTLRKNRAHVVK
jgi:hypothetical protein